MYPARRSVTWVRLRAPYVPPKLPVSMVPVCSPSFFLIPEMTVATAHMKQIREPGCGKNQGCPPLGCEREMPEAE